MRVDLRALFLGLLAFVAALHQRLSSHFASDGSVPIATVDLECVCIALGSL